MSANRLEQAIRKKIDRAGPITFERFMDLSLYHPEFGYYANKRLKIGPHGDYYTSSHLHPIFSWLIANQLDEIKRILKDPDDFTVLEIGAGRGYLAEGIVNYAQKTLKWKGNWKYIIVEKNPRIFEDQMKLLDPYKSRVVWKTSFEEMDQFCGCVISNELLDAFPVHLVVMKDRFQEVFVGTSDKGFKEIYGDIRTSDLAGYISQYKIPEISGYRTEINLNIWDYLKNLDKILSEGFVISIDYGYSAREYYAAERNKGTLFCYYRHRVNDNPYTNIGDQDITAHVNFTSLADWGNRLGFKTIGYCPQGLFLASLGIDEIVSRELETNPNFQNELLKIKGLLFGMGDTHQVLIQNKGKAEIQNLRGFGLKNRMERL